MKFVFNKKNIKLFHSDLLNQRHGHYRHEKVRFLFLSIFLNSCQTKSHTVFSLGGGIVNKLYLRNFKRNQKKSSQFLKYCCHGWHFLRISGFSGFAKLKNWNLRIRKMFHLISSKIQIMRKLHTLGPQKSTSSVVIILNITWNISKSSLKVKEQ